MLIALQLSQESKAVFLYDLTRGSLLILSHSWF